MDVIDLSHQNTRFFSWLLSHDSVFCSPECQFVNKGISLEMCAKYGHQWKIVIGSRKDKKFQQYLVCKPTLFYRYKAK